MTGNTWLKIRIGLIAFGFVSALFVPRARFEELRSFPSWVLAVVAGFAVVSLALIPVMLLFVIGIQTINPFSDKEWTPPTHHSSPFRLGNPLLFFHFGAFFIGAGGLGLLVSSLWNGLFAAAHGLLVVLGSLMLLVGVRVCMRVFKHKMAAGSPDQPLQLTSDAHDGE